MLDLLREYNRGMAKLKQYTTVNGEDGFDYDDPDKIVEALGMTPDEETRLTTVLANELKEHLAKEKRIPIQQLELQMTHIKDVEVNYDYLAELVEQLMNQVHENKVDEAMATQEEIRQFANGLEDRSYATKIIKAAAAIVSKEYPPADAKIDYPVKLDDCGPIIQDANNASLDRRFLRFRVKWGITEIVPNAKMHEMFSHHRYGQQDLDDTGWIKSILSQASEGYKQIAESEEVQALSKIKYRNALREAIYELADDLVME